MDLYRGEEKLLASLLSEYSEKLVALCDKTNAEKDKLNRLFVDLVSTVMLACLLCFAYLRTSYQALSLIALFPIVGHLFLLSTRIAMARRRQELLKREAGLFYIKLEKTVRLASQYHEHVTTGIIKLALDLGLSEAESAMEYYSGSPRIM